MKYKICASIAQKTPKSMNTTLKKALTICDYAELRLDFLKPKDVPVILDLSKRHLSKTVCTLRPKSEGGVFTGTEKERRSILKMILEYNPYLTDIEYNTLKKNPSLAKYANSEILCSWHDFKKTPSIAMLHSRKKSMQKYAKYVKIVTTAKKPHDAASILSLYSKNNSNLVAFAMGDAGRMSRLLCPYLGSPFTYVSLGKPIAPGQFSAKQIIKMQI